MFGLCQPRLGSTIHYQCLCFENDQKGYWAGSEFGGPCDRCKRGYWGTRCTQACPGGVCQTCGGHGVCSDGITGDGTCACSNSTLDGYWTGTSCTECVDGYWGPDCRGECNCHERGTARCMDGRLGDGTCVCNTGWSLNDCSQCDPGVVFPCVNTLRCPGPPDDSCYNSLGRGNCTRVSGSSDGECVCQPTYATIDCGVQCPIGNQGEICGGPTRGTCSQGRLGTGRCTCRTGFALPNCTTCTHGYWGPTCSNPCPGGTGNPCNGNGTCNGVTGLCRCNGLAGGPACSIPCPVGGNGRVCSGHGDCNATAQCRCHFDTTQGFWVGATCDSCAADFGTASCAVRCPTFNGSTCSGQGDCIQENATCSCYSGYCGRYCDTQLIMGVCLSCPVPNVYGSDCDQPCQCQNGAFCNQGKAGDGSCSCGPGWAGPYCNITCPGGLATPCSNHGRCDALTVSCVCHSGYAGKQCELSCPVLDCSGHGTCNDTATGDGTCTCDTGYVWPETGCNTTCPCGAHGTCPLGNLTCECFNGFTGVFCDRCINGRSGADCQSRCVNGRTNRTSCVCDPGWAGGECNTRCPIGPTSGLTCDGHGTCNELNGACECDLGFTGPACSCTLASCIALNPNFVCDRNTGDCICGPNFLTMTDGCDACIPGKWGPSCGSNCPCPGTQGTNNAIIQHGTCAKADGACKCFASDAKGHWGGQFCDRCATGFMGESTASEVGCRQKSVAVTVVASLVAKSNRFLISSYSMIDPERNEYIAGGSGYNVVFNITTLLPDIAVVKEGLPCLPGMATQGGEIYSVFRTNQSRLGYLAVKSPACENKRPRFYEGPDTGSIVREFMTNLSIVTDDISGLEPYYLNHAIYEKEHDTVCVITTSSTDMYCKRMAPQFASTPFDWSFTPLASISDMKWSPSRNAIILAGVSKLGSCSLVLTNRLGQSPVDYDINNLLALSGQPQCDSIQCVFQLSHDVLIFGAQTVDGGYIGAINLTSRELWGGAPRVASTGRCNAITFDTASQIGLAVFVTSVVKFRYYRDPGNDLLTIRTYGQTRLASGGIRALDLHSQQQIVYGPLVQAKGVEVMRFLLVEVSSVIPNVINRGGTTNVTIIGAGFRNTSLALCKFGDGRDVATSYARYMSPTEVHCTAPKSSSTDACVSQPVEVTMNGNTYTANNIMVERPIGVVLNDVTPTRLFLPDLANASASLRLRGRGFIDSDHAKCRLVVDPLDRARDVVLNATFNDLDNDYSCIVPAGFDYPTQNNSYLTFALDGQVFSQSSVSFSVVGVAVAVVCSPTGIRNGSSDIVTFNPAVAVISIDAAGNPLGMFDKTQRAIRVVSPTVPRFPLNGTTRYTLVNGSVLLDGIFLVEPDVGSQLFNVEANGLQDTNFTITIASGDLAQLEIRNQPIRPGFDVVQPRTLMPATALIQGVDPTGNDVRVNDRVAVAVFLEECARAADGNPTQCNVTNEYPAVPMKESGLASVAPVVVPLTFGLTYRMVYSIVGRPEINVSSVDFYASCPPLLFSVNGEAHCRPCRSEFAQCNGSNVMLTRPGYWRSSANSLEFYRCPVAKSCIAGDTLHPLGTCRPGRTGPMCNVCADGWAKDFTRRCYECNSMAFNVGIIALLLTIFISAMCAYTILMVQNWTADGSRAYDSAVVLSLAVTFLQTTSVMEYFQEDWPKAVTYLWNSIGTVADFRFYTVLASNCFFRSLGFQDSDLSLVYAGLFGLIIVIIVLVRCILWVFPRAMLSTDAGIHRDETLEALKAADTQGRNVLREHELPSIAVIATQIFVFFLLQSASYYTFAVFPCQNIDFGNNVTARLLVNDFSVSCTSESYLRVKNFATFMAVFYSLLIPAAVFAAIGYSKYRYDAYHKLYMSFLTLGIKDDRWWWLGIVVMRKILLVLSLSFGSTPLDMYLYTWIMTGYTWAAYKLRPYKNDRHNKLELTLCIVTVLTANIAMAIQVAPRPTSDLVTTAVPSANATPASPARTDDDDTLSLSSQGEMVTALAIVAIAINALAYLLITWEWVHTWVITAYRRSRVRRKAFEETERKGTKDMMQRIEREMKADEAVSGTEMLGVQVSEKRRERERSESAFRASASRATAATAGAAAVPPDRASVAPSQLSARQQAIKTYGRAKGRAMDSDEDDRAFPSEQYEYVPPGYKGPVHDDPDGDPVGQVVDDIDLFLDGDGDDELLAGMKNRASTGPKLMTASEREVPVRPHLLAQRLAAATGGSLKHQIMINEDGHLFTADELPSLPPPPMATPAVPYRERALNEAKLSQLGVALPPPAGGKKKKGGFTFSAPMARKVDNLPEDLDDVL